MAGPCGWVLDSCGCGNCWDANTPATRASASALAAMVVWAATGRRYGQCELTVMPCNSRPVPPLYQNFGLTDPFGYGLSSTSDLWPSGIGFVSGGCGAGCSCAAACEVSLAGPAVDVVEVRLSGEAVLPSAYEIHDRHLLVRTDGLCWPTCQTMGQPVPGFEVTYHRGDPIPDPVLIAARMLACEYAKACTGGACALPQRMASLSRQGVEVTLADVPTGVGGVIRTGIKIVDDVIAADNPYGQTSRREVVSPGVKSPRVVTWRGGS